MTNDNTPTPETLIALYSASAATIAIASLARVGGVSADQVDDLKSLLERCTSQSTGFAGVDRHLATLANLLSVARM